MVTSTQYCNITSFILVWKSTLTAGDPLKSAIEENLESKSASLLKAAFESLSEGDVGNISGV